LTAAVKRRWERGGGFSPMAGTVRKQHKGRCPSPLLCSDITILCPGTKKKEAHRAEHRPTSSSFLSFPSCTPTSFLTVHFFPSFLPSFLSLVFLSLREDPLPSSLPPSPLLSPYTLHSIHTADCLLVPCETPACTFIDSHSSSQLPFMTPLCSLFPL
jgi:hypothetical protein